MTTEIERQFFDTFGIEPKTYLICTSSWDCIDAQSCEECVYSKLIAGEYPQITDHILLGLILINMHNEDLFGYPTNIQELKDNTLKQLIETYNKFSTCVTYDSEYQQMAMDIKQQVCTLFKEDTDDR